MSRKSVCEFLSPKPIFFIMDNVSNILVFCYAPGLLYDSSNKNFNSIDKTTEFMDLHLYSTQYFKESTKRKYALMLIRAS